MGRIIIVASGKGGTGKTTLTSHLGAMLADCGHLTALVDADAGFRNLDIALGMESNVVYDYSDYINGKSNLDDVLVKSSELENLYFVAAPQSASTTDFDEKKTKEFWEKLKGRFEFVLADAPAGMGDGFMFAAQYADEAIIVALAETSSLRDADRVITELEDIGVQTIRLVINRMNGQLVEQKILMNVDDCMDVLAIPMLGIVPDDNAVVKSMAEGKPLMSGVGCCAAVAFRNIVMRLLGNQVPIMDFSLKKQSLFGRLKKLFSKD